MLRDGRFEMFDPAPALSMAEAADGGVWIGTQGRGLVRARARGRTWYRTQLPPVHDDVKVLLTDRDANLWIGTDAGLLRHSGHGFVRYTRHEGLSGGTVTALAEDREGGLWVGTSRGLNYLRDLDVSFLGPAQGPSNESVLTVLEVLRMVARQLDNRAIAAALGISGSTVKVHVSNVIAKLGVADRTQAVISAHRRGIVRIE